METGKKETREYVYDETNHLVEGTNWKGDVSSYTYNGVDVRINNTQTSHSGSVYSRDYVIDYTSLERDDLMVYAEGDGQLDYVQREVYAGSERLEQFTDRSNSGYERILYVHEDLMGNTRYYTKENGNSFAELTYDAWGMPESPNKLLNNDHGNYVYATYTGHIFDTTLDIYFAEARFYDANTRTWLAMDPIKDGDNWYQYGISNPITYWDPNGLLVIALGYDISEAFGIRGGIGAQLVIDDNLNVGLVTYTSVGGGFPAIGLGGAAGGVYFTDEIWDLNGLGFAVGGGINGTVFGFPVSGSLEFSFGTARDGSMVLGVFVAGKPEVALPVEMHGTLVNAEVKGINLVQALRVLGREAKTMLDDIFEIFSKYTGC